MDFDVIIIGGSYAGLSAALTLGRSIRTVLVIDDGKPCNRQTPHSHNFLTHDGDKPADISAYAKAEVLKYPTVKFLDGNVNSALKKANGFNVSLTTGENFSARKLLIATGLKEVLPNIKGFAECWGISVIHCPYCHGYEVRGERVGLIMNGDHAFELAKVINNLNKALFILTNGKSQFTQVQTELLKSKSIEIIEDEIVEIEHEDGALRNVIFKNGNKIALKATYARFDIEQHVDFNKQLGFELTDLKTIKVNEMQQTAAYGIYAAGDCTTLMRTLSVTTAAGTLAAVMINKELISEDF